MKTSRLLRVSALTLLTGLSLITTTVGAGPAADLTGTWRFRIDRDDRGLADEWWKRPRPGIDTIKLPGMMQAQGFGDEVSVDTLWTGQIVDRSWFTAPEYAKYREPGHVKVPFWLQPVKHYVGAAWYQREVEIPAAWRGRRQVLTLERPHIETRVWLDDRPIGKQDSLSTPHEYDLGTTVIPGRHRLTIRVDNHLVVDVGVNSHSVSDHTQGNWNGIAGRIELAATPPVWVADLQVFPHVATRSVTVKGRIGNATGRPGDGVLKLAIVGPGKPAGQGTSSTRVSWMDQGGTFAEEIAIGADAPLWDEFHPALHRLTATIDGEGSGGRSESFGLREIGTVGTQFAINGRKAFFRGTLECAIFPLTGHPPTDVASWKRIIGIAKDHGLNLFRFHSWCPPEAAFEAADELGFYFHVECRSWANTVDRAGPGQADRPLDLRRGRPDPRRVRQPPVVRPAGLRQRARRQGQGVPDRLGRALPQARRAAALHEPAGWPQIAANQFHVTPDPRIQGWGQGLHSRINGRPPETRTDYRDYIQPVGPRHQPRNRPMVCVSELRRDPHLPRTP